VKPFLRAVTPLMSRQRPDGRPLRIAFVSDAVLPFNTGGKEKRLDEISQRLAATGREVHVYTMKWWQGQRTIQRNGVWLHAISRRYDLYNGERRSIKQGLLFGLATLRLLFEPFDVLDVDHVPFFPLFSARLVCTIRRKPLYATWNEVWGKTYWNKYLGPSGRIASLTERLAFRMPDEIISISSHTTQRLHHTSRRLRVHTVPLGVDIERIHAIQPSMISSDVIFAGRLLKNKNVNLLIEALVIVKLRYPDVRCTIIGEGPERTRLMDLVVRLDLADNVTFSDFLVDHDELFSRLRASKVFVLPSDREGFGIVALEANACGLPVITIRHDDNAAKDLIVDGENGFIVDLNAASLAEKIEEVLGHADNHRVVDVPPGYDWSTVAQNIDAIFTRSPRHLGRTSKTS
jgi:L-malate glycosyltransferase